MMSPPARPAAPFTFDARDQSKVNQRGRPSIAIAGE